MKRFIAFLLISSIFVSCEKQAQEEPEDDKPLADLKIGDNYGGGIVFHLFKEGGGLIMAPHDIKLKVVWGCRNSKINTPGDKVGDGKENTKIILTYCKEAQIAAKEADDFSWNGYNDWYLPSRGELLAMSIMHLVDLKEKGGGNFSKGYYWSSSQTAMDSHAWAVPFGGEPGNEGPIDKDEKLWVRPIRSF